MIIPPSEFLEIIFVKNFRLRITNLEHLLVEELVLKMEGGGGSYCGGGSYGTGNKKKPDIEPYIPKKVQEQIELTDDIATAGGWWWWKCG